MSTNEDNQGFAIVGMSGRFPGAPNIDKFWENISNGVESIKPLSDDELREAGVDQKLIDNPDYVKVFSGLKGIDLFDAGFFNFTPREAEVTDPQLRLLLECGYEALEQAGYPSSKTDEKIGAFAGADRSKYLYHNLLPYPEYSGEWGLGSIDVLIVNRNDHIAPQLSYRMDLTGPSVNLNSACATSLVVIHAACQSLLTYECDIALAGCTRITPYKSGYMYKEGGIKSVDGHCRSFDEKASGTVFGDGVGLIVIKRLADAIENNDTIHAVIKSSATNNDGSDKIGYAAPSAAGQAEVIVEAQAIADVPAETITYVETHGTATRLGDPIEVSALSEAFHSQTDKKQFCAIGSVKSNVGHLDISAGFAGIIKTVEALKHKKLPPSINYEKPNPEIDFENSPFYVNTELKPWKTDGIPRRAAVSCFGIGGNNAHVILEEPPEMKPSSPEKKNNLIVLSAKTENALAKMKENLKNHLLSNNDINLSDLAYTLQVGREEFRNRFILPISSREEAIELLSNNHSSTSFVKEKSKIDNPVCFMFTGQGSQFINMGVSLYKHEPVFQNAIDECADILESTLGLDIRDLLYPDLNKVITDQELDKAKEKLNQTCYTQPALFVIEYALTHLWKSRGISPHVMIGHSIGEYVAAYFAGVFTLEDALEIVSVRGRLMQSLPAGGMLAVSSSLQELEDILVNIPNCSIAAINTTSQFTVSGNLDEIDALSNILNDKGIIHQKIGNFSCVSLCDDGTDFRRF
jgi:acyl transferase domain-containing protein